MDERTLFAYRREQLIQSSFAGETHVRVENYAKYKFFGKYKDSYAGCSKRVYIPSQVRKPTDPALYEGHLCVNNHYVAEGNDLYLGYGLDSLVSEWVCRLCGNRLAYLLLREIGRLCETAIGIPGVLWRDGQRSCKFPCFWPSHFGMSREEKKSRPLPAYNS
jgi:hypothetical protein